MKSDIQINDAEEQKIVKMGKTWWVVPVVLIIAVIGIIIYEKECGKVSKNDLKESSFTTIDKNIKGEPELMLKITKVTNEYFVYTAYLIGEEVFPSDTCKIDSWEKGSLIFCDNNRLGFCKGTLKKSWTDGVYITIEYNNLSNKKDRFFKTNRK